MTGETAAVDPRPQAGILTAATIGCTLGYGNLAVVSFGIFFLPLVKVTGWSRSQVALGVTLMTLGSVVSSASAGFLADRFGTRRIVLPAILLLAAAFALLSFAQLSLGAFYAGYAFLGLIGGGTMPITYTRAITSAFDGGRGLALAIALTGTGIGAIALPLVLGPAIEQLGIAASYRALALAALFALVPVYFMIGGNDAPVASIDARPIGDTNDASGTSYFLRIAAAGFFLGALTGATWGTLVALLVDRGVSQHTAQLTMSGLAASMVAGRLVAGYLLDRIFGPFVAAASLLPVVVGLALLAGQGSSTLAVTAAILIGIGIGAEFDFMAYLCGRYFPRAHYGRAYGGIYSIFLIGGAIAPLAINLSAARLGSDTPGLVVILLGVAAAIALLLSLGRYPQRDS